MLEAESCFDRAMARCIASFVGKGGGLFDLSVKESEGPSCGLISGVRERVCRSRSRSVSSLIFVRADEGNIPSVLCRPLTMPAQSPDTGRVLENSGDAESGVRESSSSCQDHLYEIFMGSLT